MTTTTRTNQNAFFELRLSIFAGSNQRAAFDKKALALMGFNEMDFDAVRAMLQASVLPKEAFHPFLAIRKAVQAYLSTKGVNHDLMGRVFNPSERIEIVNFLKDQQEKYNQAKVQFINDYSAYKQEQLEKVENSAIAKGLDPKPLSQAVAKNQPPVSYYERKLEFRFLDLSIELDSEQWAEEIDKINSDIEARTVYETQRDADEIRDIDNPRTKAKALLSLASRFKSLEFYVPGLKALAQEVEDLIQNLGGLKPAKAYEAKEVLMMTGAAKQISQNSHSLVALKVPLSNFMASEAAYIEQMFADEDQLELSETDTTEVEQSTEAVEAEATQDDSQEESVSTPVAPTPKPAAVTTGAFNF